MRNATLNINMRMYYYNCKGYKSVESYILHKYWGGTYSTTSGLKHAFHEEGDQQEKTYNTSPPRWANRQWREFNNPAQSIKTKVTLSDKCWDLHPFFIDENDRGLCTYEIDNILVGVRCLNSVNDTICLIVTDFTLDEVYRLLLLPSLVTVNIMKPYDF
jgi:hypothetical protein